MGAQHRCKEVNPLDYTFKALGCHLEVMDSSSPETQMILEACHKLKTSSVDVMAVYRVERAEEKLRMKTGVHHNRRLLWHGTKTAHMIGILQQGLLISHSGVHRTARIYGEGIYFSYEVDKALQYVSWDRGNPRGCLLLCEVALGDTAVLEDVGTRELPEGKHSTWLKARKKPD